MTRHLQLLALGLTLLVAGCLESPQLNKGNDSSLDLKVLDARDLVDATWEVEVAGPDAVDIVDVPELDVPDIAETVDLTDAVAELPPHIVDVVHDLPPHVLPDLVAEVTCQDIFKPPSDPCFGECPLHAVMCNDAHDGYTSCVPGKSGCNGWLKEVMCPADQRCACRGSRPCLPDGPACVCVPDCSGKNCGDDGCGGTCGDCDASSLCIDGLCVCQPDCTDKLCGDDGCGSSCGDCLGPQDACVDGECVCQPACEAKECGHDGCGGACGACEGNYFCNPDQLCEWVMEICADGWCEIPAGEVFAGPGEEEICAGSNEVKRSVKISRSFLMGQHEVTQFEWVAVLGGFGNPSAHSECGADCPVEQISWLDAINLCNAWSSQEGFEPCYVVTEQEDGSVDVTWPLGPECTGYRLPTDAEWEYAYRAGRKSAFHNGDITVCNGSDGALNQIAWYGSNSGNDVHFYGYKLANGWGLFDMSGNVSEWVWDWHESPLPVGEFTDPVGPASGQFKVVRNCAYTDYPKHCRAAYRQFAEAGDVKNNRGLRVVRTLPPEVPAENEPQP